MQADMVTWNVGIKFPVSGSKRLLSHVNEGPRTEFVYKTFPRLYEGISVLPDSCSGDVYAKTLRILAIASLAGTSAPIMFVNTSVSRRAALV